MFFKLSQPSVTSHLQHDKGPISFGALFVFLGYLFCLTTQIEAQTPVVAQFNPKNNYGLTEIIVDGQNLLLVNGFHIIGSKTGADNNDNINSESPNNRNGVMVSSNPNIGTLPYSLTFNKASNDSSKLLFAITVGPSTESFNSLSLPLECRMQHFNFWRSSSSSTINRYDKNRLAYPNPPNPGDKNYYIEGVPGTPKWGEIIGPKYTIRITITSSTYPAPLYFVNAPGLSSGDRDVEFAFRSGGLPAGKSASVSGFIQVFRTDANILPATVYQSESSPHHLIGRKDADGWSVNVNDHAGSFMQYGPYVDVAAWGGLSSGSTAFSAGSHTAKFRLMLDNVTANNNRILTIDVFNSTTGTVLKKMDITRKMFDAAFRYKEFALDFDSTPGQRLEFRTYWWGGSYVRQDSVIVR